MPKRRRYYKELRISQLRAVMQIAQGKGFARAAAELGLTSPSVWQQVRGLEDEFGISLVEVEGQQVTLTEQGQILADLSGPIVRGFDSLREQFTELTQMQAHKLSVAAPGNVLVNELPSPIRKYREQHPEIELSLIDIPSNPARKLLEDGEVDLAVVGQLQKNFPTSLIADHVTSFPFTLVCRSNHPILESKRIGPKQMSHYPLVMSSIGTNTRHRVDEVFAKAGLQDQLRIAFVTSTKELLLQYVQMNFGIAVVPVSPRYRAVVDSPYGDIRQLAFRDVSKVFGYEHIVILRRKLRHEPPHQQAFRETVLSSLIK